MPDVSQVPVLPSNPHPTTKPPFLGPFSFGHVFISLKFLFLSTPQYNVLSIVNAIAMGWRMCSFMTVTKEHSKTLQRVVVLLQLNASDAAPCSDNVNKEGDKVNDPCARLPTGFFHHQTGLGKRRKRVSERERERERGKTGLSSSFPFLFSCSRIIPVYIISYSCSLSLFFLSPPLLLFYDYCLFD